MEWWTVYYTVRGDHYGGERSTSVLAVSRADAREQVAGMDAAYMPTRAAQEWASIRGEK